MSHHLTTGEKTLRIGSLLAPGRITDLDPRLRVVLAAVVAVTTLLADQSRADEHPAAGG